MEKFLGIERRAMFAWDFCCLVCGSSDHHTTYRVWTKIVADFFRTRREGDCGLSGFVGLVDEQI